MIELNYSITSLNITNKINIGYSFNRKNRYFFITFDYNKLD